MADAAMLKATCRRQERAIGQLEALVEENSKAIDTRFFLTMQRRATGATATQVNSDDSLCHECDTVPVS